MTSVSLRTWIVSRWVLAELRIWCKKAPFFSPNESNEINGVKKRLYLHHFVCIRHPWCREPWPWVPIERHGRPRPCERRGPTIVGRMSASEPFDGTQVQGGDIFMVSEILRLRHCLMTPANGGSGGDLRWRSSLRLSPAPPIYEVMGDHGSPAGTPVRLSTSTIILRKRQESELRPRIAKHLSGRVRTPAAICL